jgi:hypothetical protein
MMQDLKFVPIDSRDAILNPEMKGYYWPDGFWPYQHPHVVLSGDLQVAFVVINHPVDVMYAYVDVLVVDRAGRAARDRARPAADPLTSD